MRVDIITATVDVHWPGVPVSSVFHKAVELFEKAGMGDAASPSMTGMRALAGRNGVAKVILRATGGI